MAMTSNVPYRDGPMNRVGERLKPPEALVALAMLALGGYCPPLPGRETPK